MHRITNLRFEHSLNIGILGIYRVADTGDVKPGELLIRIICRVYTSTQSLFVRRIELMLTTKRNQQFSRLGLYLPASSLLQRQKSEWK